MGNKKPGVKVPGASGKCIRPDGPCIGPKEEKKSEPGVCRVCGCTEENACEGGCAWANEEKTLCTACVDEE